jgi:RNA polymerase sigma-70 factor (ECF subfamily)
VIGETVILDVVICEVEIASANVVAHFHTVRGRACPKSSGQESTEKNGKSTNGNCPASPGDDPELLYRAQHYLRGREKGECPGQGLEAAWEQFYEFYSRKIRSYAFKCGAQEKDISDCVQEVWAELVKRLPGFQLDPRKGKFDTWLFDIVRGKAADTQRFRRRSLVHKNPDVFTSLTDLRPQPGQALEEQEFGDRALGCLRQRLSPCTFQVFYLRLVEQRPVAEVAQALRLTHEQTWYRYHRARQELDKVASALIQGRDLSHSIDA